MNTLALDCATSNLLISLEVADSRRFHFQTETKNNHSRYLMTAVESLLSLAELKPVDLDLIVCGKGPGSFTGLRIAMATGKALAMGASASIISISSLDMMARPLSWFPGLVMPVIDARRNRIYTALYRDGVKLLPECDIEAERVLKQYEEEDILICGTDRALLGEYAENNRHLVIAEASTGITAEALLDLGREEFDRRGGDPITEGPLYIRKSDAEIEAEMRQG